MTKLMSAGRKQSAKHVALFLCTTSVRQPPRTLGTSVTTMDELPHDPFA
jgi:hypothetical protein